MDDQASAGNPPALALLVRELEQAEAYQQRLRQLIIDVRDQLAAGNASMAMSMLNAALNDIDSATDVVTPHRR